MSTWRLAALLVLGFVIRLAALPLPGTGDVLIWKTWSYNAAVSGETTIYGVGGRPPQRKELTYRRRDVSFAVDYPPLSVFALGAAGRAYRTIAPEMPDTPTFTAFVKLPALLAEVGLAWVVFAAVRRWAGRGPALAAVLGCWLNPALLVSGSALGYLDALFVLPAVGAVVAAAAGRTWLTGALFAAATLTKAQGALLGPLIVVGIVNATTRSGNRRAEPMGLRLGEAAAGAAIVTVAVVAPFALAGTLPNLLAGLRSLAHHDMLSGNAANVWWIATWLIRAIDVLPDVAPWQAFTAPPRVLAISVVEGLGSPNIRAVGLALMSAAWGWGLWRARHARDAWLLAGVAAFLVHAYFVLAAQVHENHLVLAVPLAVLAGAGRPQWRAVAAALSVALFLNLNLFYGFSEGLVSNFAIPRSITVVDAVVVLSVANAIALGWHARVVWLQTRLSAGTPDAETTG